MINIRPHHLLCMQGFVGKGYNEEFTHNMARIAALFKNDSRTNLKMVFGTDDICVKCPNMTSANSCSSQGKVTELDNGVIQLLDLQEEVYAYADLITRIKANLTKNRYNVICHDCSWHELGYCWNGLRSLIEVRNDLDGGDNIDQC